MLSTTAEQTAVNASGASPSSQPPVELLDLLRQTFLAVAAEPDSGDAVYVAAARLADAATRHGVRSAAQLLPLIHAAWEQLPASDPLPLERREALLHRVTSVLIATHYEGR